MTKFQEGDWAYIDPEVGPHWFGPVVQVKLVDPNYSSPDVFVGACWPNGVPIDLAVKALRLATAEEIEKYTQT